MRLLLSALPLLTLAAGCTTEPPPDTGRPEDRFDITRPGDSLLAGTVDVVSINTPGKQAEEPFYFEALLRNRTQDALSLEFRTIWKDSNDQEVAADPWTPVDIPPGADKAIAGEATNPAAAMFKLEVRRKP